MANLRKVIYINEEDYSTLINGDSLVIDGTTYTYEENALYVIKNAGPPEYAETAGYATNAGTSLVAVTDASGNNIAATYEKKPLIIEANESDDGSGLESGTYDSITQALALSKLVILKLTMTESLDNEIIYVPLNCDYPNGSSYYFTTVHGWRKYEIVIDDSNVISIYVNELASNSTVVHKAQSETITGHKTFTGAVSLGSNATATTPATTDNDTSVATTAFVHNVVNELPEPMIFKGSLGTGGTITALPTAATSNEGFTYKVITAGTYASQSAKIGDTFISDGSNWILIPSGDEPSGTVTSVKIQATSPIAIDDSTAITTSGTRTISHNDSGVTAGTYKSVTVDAKGHVTAGTNPTTLAGYGITDAKITNGIITLGSNNITIPTKTSDLTNDSKFIQDKGGGSGMNSLTSVIDCAFSSEDTVLTCQGRQAAVNVNPGGVDIISNWAGNSNDVDENGTRDVEIHTSKGKAYYNSKEIATVDQIPSASTTSPVMDGTAAVGSSTTYARADHVHPHDTTTITKQDYLMPTNSFGGSERAIQINSLNDGFYALSSRPGITVTLDGSTSNVAKLFNGNYEDNVVISAGNTGVLLIDCGNTAFTTYTYGYLYLSFYYKSIPESVSIRVFGTRNGAEDWYSYNNPEYYFGTSESTVNVCIRALNTSIHSIKKWEITIVAKSTIDTLLTQVEHQWSRGSQTMMSAVTKFAIPQDLYGEVTAPKFIKRGGTSSQFLKADGSVDSNTYQTAITSNNKLSADLISDGTANKVYTATEKTKLAGIEEGAEANVQSDWSATSGDAAILNKPGIISISDYGDIAGYGLYAFDGQESELISITGEGSDIIENTEYTYYTGYIYSGDGAIPIKVYPEGDSEGNTIISGKSELIKTYSYSEIDDIVDPGVYRISDTVPNTNNGILIVNLSLRSGTPPTLVCYQTFVTINDIKQRHSNENTFENIEWESLMPNLTLSELYAPSNLENEDLYLAPGDTYEVAFKKLHKAILDDEETIAASLNELNDKIPTIDTELSETSENPVQNKVITQTILDNEYVTSTALNNLNNRIEAKQNTLISGTNIKTINGNSLLGSGNITISGGGGSSNNFDIIEVNCNFRADINKDGSISLLDATSMTLGGVHGTAPTDDVNNDGSITITDATAINALVLTNSAANILFNLETNPYSSITSSFTNSKIPILRLIFIGGNTFDIFVQKYSNNTYLGEELYYVDVPANGEGTELENFIKKIFVSISETSAIGIIGGIVTREGLATKQDTLVSGTNIKTINNESILGSGNITIQGGSGGGGDTNVIETIKVNGTALTPDNNKAVDITVPTKITTDADSTFIEGNPAIVIHDGNHNNAWVSGRITIDPSGSIDIISLNDLDLIVPTGNKVTYNSKEVATVDQIPSAVTESTVSGWGFTKNTGTVTGVKMNGTTKNPTSGVVDLGTVLTSFTETDPTVSAWAKAANKPTYTAAEVGALPDTYTPPVTSVNGQTGVVNLTIPSAPGTLNTTATTAQSTSSSEALSGNITLHKVAKTGTYNDLIGKPTIPAAVTESTVSGWGFTKNTGTYSKPSGGIPASDLAEGVIPTVPTNVSAFTNDAGYLTSASVITIYSGSTAPSSSLGNNGDIYIQTS